MIAWSPWETLIFFRFHIEAFYQSIKYFSSKWYLDFGENNIKVSNEDEAIIRYMKQFLLFNSQQRSDNVKSRQRNHSWFTWLSVIHNTNSRVYFVKKKLTKVSFNLKHEEVCLLLYMKLSKNFYLEDILDNIYFSKESYTRVALSCWQILSAMGTSPPNLPFSITQFCNSRRYQGWYHWVVSPIANYFSNQYRN